MGGLVWSGDDRSHWLHRPGQTASAENSLCSGCGAAQRTGCHYPSGSRVNLVRHGFNQPLKRLSGCLAIGFLHQLGDYELAGPIDGHKEI